MRRALYGDITNIFTSRSSKNLGSGCPIGATQEKIYNHQSESDSKRFRVNKRFMTIRDTFENTPDENEPKFKCVESRYMARKNYSYADQLLNRLQTAAGTETMEYGLDTDPLLSALLQAVAGIGSTETVLHGCKRKSPP
jgi:hypothetical protein